MNESEWQATVGHINHDIAGIVRSQQVLAEVHAELNQRRDNPIEEDFIFADGLGQEPGAPRVRMVDGIEIQIRILHRRGLRQSDIKGADLLYEIAGQKFVLVQYKSPDRNGRVHADGSQLKELMAACPNPCPPAEVGFWPTCGAWYAIRGTGESLYMPACSAQAAFGTAASRHSERFMHGITPEGFVGLFGRCWTGARTKPDEFAYLTWAAMEHDRVLFQVLQRGTFGRW